MRVAVTGGSGQLGTLVLRRLVDDRAVKGIVSIDVRPPLITAGKLRAVEMDIRSPDLGRELEGCDVLVHLAFVVIRADKREVIDSINIEGSKNVFRAGAAAGIRKMVYSSSVAAYGVVPGHPRPIVEDTPRRYQPGFAYAATKYRVEEFLDEFEAAHPELSIVRLRPAILVGRRMDHALGRAFRHRIMPARKDGTPLPIVWDEDVADAVILGAKRDLRGAFNLGADEPLTPEELAAATGMRLVSLPRWLAISAARLSPLLARIGIGEAQDPAWIESSATMVMSSERARRELGWKPRHPTSIAVMRHFLDEVPARPDPRLRLFFRLVRLAARRGPPQRELAGYDGKIHLALTGPGGGDFGLLVGDGRVDVTTRPPRPPSAVVTMRASLFLDLLAGKGDFGTAQLTGKVRVEGQGHAQMIVGGLITQFRARLDETGATGRVTRALSRWFSRGAK